MVRTAASFKCVAIHYKLANRGNSFLEENTYLLECFSCSGKQIGSCIG